HIPMFRQKVGSSRSKLVRFKTQQANRTVFQLASRTRSKSSRCIQTELDTHSWMGKSSFQSDRQSDSKGYQEQSKNYIDSTNLANSSMVCRPSDSVGRLANITP